MIVHLLKVKVFAILYLAKALVSLTIVGGNMKDFQSFTQDLCLRHKLGMCTKMHRNGEKYEDK